jgi:hypothetical protein
MALQFPSNPGVGQIYQQWVWDGAIWMRGGTGVTVDGLPPPSPLQGDLWWRTTVGQLFVYYKENGQSQWVIANSGGGSWPPQGVTDGSDAPPGAIGEFLSVVNTVPSLTSGIWQNLSVINLPAGDWDVFGTVFLNSSTNSGNGAAIGLSLAPASIGLTTDYTTTAWMGWSANFALTTPPMRQNLTSTTPIYLAVYLTFGSGTVYANNVIRARRMR